MSLYGWRVKNVEKDGKRAKETNESHNWPCPFWTWHMKKKRLSFFMSDNQVK